MNLEYYLTSLFMFILILIVINYLINKNKCNCLDKEDYDIIKKNLIIKIFLLILQIILIKYDNIEFIKLINSFVIDILLGGYILLTSRDIMSFINNSKNCECAKYLYTHYIIISIIVFFIFYKKNLK